MLRHVWGLSQRIIQAAHGCAMYRNATQAITKNTVTKILLDTTEYDSGNMGDTSNNRINIRRTGFYLILARWNLNTLDAGGSTPGLSENSAKTGFDYVRIQVNGTGIMSNRKCVPDGSASNLDQEVLAATVESLVSGDYVEMSVFHNDGTAGSSKNTLTTDEGRPTLEVLELV
jgi:hypothetical protein